MNVRLKNYNGGNNFGGLEYLRRPLIVGNF